MMEIEHDIAALHEHEKMSRNAVADGEAVLHAEGAREARRRRAGRARPGARLSCDVLSHCVRICRTRRAFQGAGGGALGCLVRGRCDQETGK